MAWDLTLCATDHKENRDHRAHRTHVDSPKEKK